MSRKKLFDEVVQRQGGVVGRVQLLGGAVRGIIQNHGTITAESAAEWERACREQAKLVKEALDEFKATNRKVRQYVKDHVQSSAPEE